MAQRRRLCRFLYPLSQRRSWNREIRASCGPEPTTAAGSLGGFVVDMLTIDLNGGTAMAFMEPDWFNYGTWRFFIQFVPSF